MDHAVLILGGLIGAAAVLAILTWMKDHHGTLTLKVKSSG